MKKAHKLATGYTLILTALLYAVLSCDRHQSSALDGSYTIKGMTVNGEDFMHNLHFPSLGFRSRPNEAWFHGTKVFEKDHHAQWGVISESEKVDSIEIKSKINILNGRYKVIMSRNHNKARLDLVSKNVRIESYKIVD